MSAVVPRRGRRIFRALPVLGVGLALAGCSGVGGISSAARGPTGSGRNTAGVTRSVAAEPGMTIFVCSGTENDTLFQWADRHGALDGTFQYSALSGTAPDQKVSSSPGTLGGTASGPAITLDLSAGGAFSSLIPREQISGSVQGDTLSLNIPQADGSFQVGTCTRSSLSGWNSRIAVLESTARSDDTQALRQQASASQQAARASAAAQHQQTVSQAQSSLGDDINTLENDSHSLNDDTTLAGDIQTMRSDYGTEESDFTTEKADSCDGMGGDASGVASDSDSVDTDLDSLSNDVANLQGDFGIQEIRSDVSTVQGDLSTLKGLGVTPSTPSMSPLADAGKAIKNADAAISWAQEQGKTIDAEAHQLSTAAENYATAHCPNN